MRATTTLLLARCWEFELAAYRIPVKRASQEWGLDSPVTEPIAWTSTPPAVSRYWLPGQTTPAVAAA